MLPTIMKQETYEKLQKKHYLPNFDEINAYFEIADIEDDSAFLLRDIRRKIQDVAMYYAKILEDLLHPETSSAMHEVSLLTEKDREELLLTYKHLRKIERTGLYIGLGYDDKEDTQFISKAVSSWNDISKPLRKISQKIALSWDSETPREKDTAYFG